MSEQRLDQLMRIEKEIERIEQQVNQIESEIEEDKKHLEQHKVKEVQIKQHLDKYVRKEQNNFADSPEPRPSDAFGEQYERGLGTFNNKDADATRFSMEEQKLLQEELGIRSLMMLNSKSEMMPS